MKTIKISAASALLLLGLFLSSFDCRAANYDEEILRAMRDEITRTLSSLSVDKLQKPYYLEYTLRVQNAHHIKAALGSIDESDSNMTSRLTVGIRLGSYKFDNTNFFDVGLGFFGSSDDEEPFKNRQVPIELDYQSLRRELWLATDASYKQAAEIYSKKEATIKNKLRRDTTEDFNPMPPEKLIDTIAAPRFPVEKFIEICKNASAVFTAYPEIQVSSIGIEYLPETVYYVNSEGREYIRTDLFTGLEMTAMTQSGDGLPMSNIYSAYSKSPLNLPSADSIWNAAENLAGKLKRMTEAKELEEPYTGPVLFEGQAAAELFAQVFAPNLVAQRQMLTENGSQDQGRFTSFQTKIGGRVLPEFLSVKALPQLDKFAGTELNGSYKIDDEGVPSQNLTLVDKGYLKTLLISRDPIRRIHKSNGHDRGSAPMLSVIELESDKEHSQPAKALKDKMLKLCKDRDLPYGIIVRKAMNQNILYTTLYRVSYGNYPLPQSETKIPLIEVYKVFPDGREEMVKGVESNGFSVPSFKDILLVGNKHFAMNYLAPAVVSPFMTGGNQYIGSTIITPDILFEDGEIKPVDEDYPKLPLLANPIKN